ncbi:MAG: tetraacyldisaccharide 4'-kinase, partial [Magnetococcales bacterium]|nr:tetraacyldisaccharide 4'-kinase [Magnetococcales bacterium]
MHRLLPWLRGERTPDSPLLRGLLAVLGTLGKLLALYQRWRVGRYAQGRRRGYRAPCPVISVGNLTVGGTGKTPMVIALARRIRDSGGRVAVVSRGYRQRSRARVTVVADHDRVHLAVPEAADEAVLLARSLPGVAVLTGPDRAALIRHATERLGSDWILMDDGFHRLDVERDLDLVLLDARRPFGNGFLLPGGILRESPEALMRCDAVILTRAEAAGGARAYMGDRFPGKPILTATHRPVGWIDARQPGLLLPLAGVRGDVMAFCGLGAPGASLWEPLCRANSS